MLCVPKVLPFLLIIFYVCAANSAVEVRLGHRLTNNYKVAFDNSVKSAKPLMLNLRQLETEENIGQTEVPETSEPVKGETTENLEEAEEEDIDYEDLDETDLLELLLSEYGANAEDEEEETSNIGGEAEEDEETSNEVEPEDEEQLLQLLQSLGIQQTGRATIPLRKLRRRLARIPRRLLRRFIREFL